jgi:glycosyltransferase involved in cell wall biosynthesis
MQRTVLVVPAYNEAARLDTNAFLRACASEPKLGFLFVDDGSTDDTDSLLRDLERSAPDRISVLQLTKNQGKAEAVRRGMSSAFGRDPAIVGYFDADLATPLGEASKMAALFENPNVQAVLGSRVALLGRQVIRSHARHYLGRVFASSASLVLGLSVYDTQCGAKLFRNTQAVRRVFASPFLVDWSFDVEVLARLSVLSEHGQVAPLDECVVEFPLDEWRDVRGTKLTAFGAGRAGLDLFRVLARYRRGRGEPDW